MDDVWLKARRTTESLSPLRIELDPEPRQITRGRSRNEPYVSQELGERDLIQER
jgi:hypothetical protein